MTPVIPSRGVRVCGLALCAAIALTGCADLVAPSPSAPPAPGPIAHDPSFPPSEDPVSPVPPEDGRLRLLRVEPDTDDVRGGIDVMLSGTGFRDGLTVLFGASPAPEVFVVNHTTAIVTAPPHPAGRVDVTAFHPDVDDGEPQVLAAAFHYRADLVISSIDPPEGDVAGGEPLTVRGSGFVAGTRFFVGGRPAILQTRVDDTTLTGIAPPNPAGAVDVHVVTPDAIAALKDAFRYRAAPQVSGLTPNAGPVAGGTLVRIAGAGFDAETIVRFAASEAVTRAVAADGAWLEAVAPPAPSGGGEVGDVTVISTWGVDVAEGAWAWLAPDADPRDLACVTFFPRRGASAGGDAVTLACHGLHYGVEVLFGDAAAEVVDVDADAAQVTVIAPPGEGEVAITVASPFDEVTLDGLFRYEPAPSLALSAVSPASGHPDGGDVVTVTGAGFGAGAQLSVGALPASAVNVIDETTLTARTPPGAPGLADVVVRQGGATARLDAAFDYLGPTLTLDLIAPATAAQSGGTWLRVRGSGFSPDTAVLIGGEPCPVVARVSSAELHVLSPPLPVGDHDVSVVDDGREASLGDVFSVFDPRSGFGGTWGPPIDETLNVTVWGSGGFGPIPGAFVMVGRDPSTPLKGYTDELGQLTISRPGFDGPVEVTATKEGFTAYSVVHFDATNVTIYLQQNPIPPPTPGGGGGVGPPPNAILRGKVFGLDKYVVSPPGGCEGVRIDETAHCAPCELHVGCLDADGFACVELGLDGGRCVAACETDVDCPTGYGCGATSRGARCLPSPGERVAYCNVSSTSLFGYEYPIPDTGWVSPGGTYELDSRRLGDIAVYCFGGYRSADGVFTPTVFGVRRHIFAMAGALHEGLDVELSHPLRRTFRLRLMDPPTWPTGVLPPNIVISLDLGADGVVPFSRRYLDAGDDIWLAPRQLAALSGSVYDARYFLYTTIQADVVGPYPRSYNIVPQVTRVVEDRLPVFADGAWTLEGAFIERDLYGLYGATGGPLYAVGEGGLILLHSPFGWTEQTSQTDATLRAIDGRSGQDVWAVGDRGTVRHWDGLAWTPIAAPDDDYRAVAVAPGRDEVLVAGAIRVRSRADDAWGVTGPPALQAIHGLDLLPDGRAAAVGALGRAFARDTAGVWAPVATPASGAILRAVWIDPTPDPSSDPANSAWVVVGDGGTVLVGSPETGLEAVDLDVSADLRAVSPTADGGVVAVGDNGAVVWRDPDGLWRTETIRDYRSVAHGVHAPADGGPIRVVGGAAFILGPFMHFPVITAPVHDASLEDTTLAWTSTGGPTPEYVRLRLIATSGMTDWELVVDGAVGATALPDIRAAAGFDALSSGRRRFEVTRVLHDGFSVDGYTTRLFNIYLRDSWSINESIFFVP